MSNQGRNIETAFCRDCLDDIEKFQQNMLCPNCASPRIVSHSELNDLNIAHIDCDAFYASVEKRDDPRLNSKPLIIGGSTRGVVATCCYIARTYGVKSAMPMFKAKKLCPSAVVLPSNMKKYSAVSQEIRDIFNQLTPLVEPISIDEAFLDLSGTQKLHGMSGAKTLSKAAKRISDEIGITVSIGLSYNKFLAKVASNLDKPQGFSVIGKQQAKSLLAPLAIDKIWGVGSVLNKKMNRSGIRNIGQLQTMELKKLVKDYGAIGERLYYFSRGIDQRSICPDQKIKSISNEHTLEEDLSDYNMLKKILWPLCEKVSSRLKEKNISGKTITLKLKTKSFRTISRAISLTGSTQMAETLYENATRLLKEQCDGMEYRLIGIGVSKLVSDQNSDLPDLLDLTNNKSLKTEKTIDKIRNKYGADIINKGRKFT